MTSDLSVEGIINEGLPADPGERITLPPLFPATGSTATALAPESQI